MSDENSKKPLDDVLRELDRDVLGMPLEHVREELAEQALDYDQLANSGRSFVLGLVRERKRASWMKTAEVRRQRFEEKIQRSGQWIRERTNELLAAGHPEIQAAFRDRKPDEMTDEELRSLAEEQAIAEALDVDDDG